MQIKNVLHSGPVIGGLTALTSPFLWPHFFPHLWPQDIQTMVLGHDPYWISHMYEMIVFPVALPVGVLSGLMMHWTLKPLVYGSPNIPWTSRSLPALLAVLTACLLYFTQCKQQPEELYWIDRLDPKTGDHVSYNIKTQVSKADDGQKAGTVSWRRDSIITIASVLKGGLFGLGGIADFDWKEDKDWKARKIARKRKRESIPSADKPLTSQNATISNLHYYSYAHALVDALVRTKTLELASYSSSNPSNHPSGLNATPISRQELRQHEQDLQRDLAVRLHGDLQTPLPILLRDVELLILTTRKIAKVAASGKVGSGNLNGNGSGNGSGSGSGNGSGSSADDSQSLASLRARQHELTTRILSSARTVEEIGYNSYKADQVRAVCSVTCC